MRKLGCRRGEAAQHKKYILKYLAMGARPAVFAMLQPDDHLQSCGDAGEGISDENSQ